MKRLLLPLAALVLAACGSQSQPEPPTSVPRRDDADLGALQMTVFEELNQAAKESYVYPDFGGLDWDAEAALVRHRIEAGMTEEQFADALRNLVAGLPDGTADYLTRDERIQAEFDSGTAYEGIGAFVSFRTEPRPRVLLLSIIEGSPADQAGLRAHDAVYAVDGLPVTEEEGLSVIERVRGPAGTSVRLEVASPSEAPRDVLVRRDRVSATDTLKGGLLSSGMLYVLVPVAVDDALVDTVAGLLQTSETEGQEILGMVLDLRISGSGADWPLTEMLTLLGTGRMGHFTSRDGEQEIVIPGMDIGNSQTIPLAILVGPDTRGASEIFAAALQGTGRAPLVGLPTDGNVLSYRSLTLADGSLLTFAESSYVTPTGQDLGRGGLIPDILVEFDWDQVIPENDTVLLRAIDLLRSG